MKILFIGDIFAAPGRRIVADHLQDIIKAQQIDLAIANADAGAYAYTDGAIDQAWRAVQELTGSGAS